MKWTKWTKDEQDKLNAAIYRVCKSVRSFDEAVAIASSKGSARGIISPKEWAFVSEHVGTKSVKQCQDRLQTEVRLRNVRRIRAAAEQEPEQLVIPPAPWGVDVSPYMGKPTGRTVWRDGHAV